MNKPSYEELLARVHQLEKINSEYRNLHDDLDLAHERLNLSLSAGNLAWWEWNVKNNLVTYNDNKVRMLGYDRNDFPEPCPYSAFTDLLHPDDYEKTMNAMRRHLSGQAELYEVEYRIRNKDGKYRWFYDRGSVTRKDHSGTPLQLKGIVFDATDRKEAELSLLKSKNDLKESNAAKDKILSIIGHDLRNSVSGFTQLLKQMVDDPDAYSESEFSEMLTMLKDSSRATYEMLDNLLLWARSQSRSVEFDPDYHSVSDIVREKCTEVRLNADLKHISLHTQIDDNHIAWCDRTMVGIAIRNFLSNAVKYTPKGGTITVKVRSLEQYVAVEVIDTGIGMDEASVSSLFDLSSRVRHAGTEGENGTGLGLLLCRDFVEQSGGTISVESEPEKGSRFTITVPACPTETASHE